MQWQEDDKENRPVEITPGQRQSQALLAEGHVYYCDIEGCNCLGQNLTDPNDRSCPTVEQVSENSSSKHTAMVQGPFSSQPLPVSEEIYRPPMRLWKSMSQSEFELEDFIGNCTGNSQRLFNKNP